MNYQLTYKNNAAVFLIKEDSLIAADSDLLIEEVKNILQKGNLGFVIDLNQVK